MQDNGKSNLLSPKSLPIMKAKFTRKRENVRISKLGNVRISKLGNVIVCARRLSLSSAKAQSAQSFLCRVTFGSAQAHNYSQRRRREELRVRTMDNDFVTAGLCELCRECSTTSRALFSNGPCNRLAARQARTLASSAPLREI